MYKEKLRKHNLLNIYNIADQLTLKSLAVYTSYDNLDYNEEIIINASQIIEKIDI